MSVTNRRSSRTLIYLAFALLVIGAVSLYSYHFENRNYRQDEAWTVHLAMSQSFGDSVMSRLRTMPGWLLVADVWVNAFGNQEKITRFLPTLYAALSLALLYRLTADLFNRRVALMAVFILGTSAFFQFYGHEIRPYSALAAGVIGSQLAFIRWLRRPRRRYALLYLAFTIGALYAHIFAVYLVLAQAIFFALIVRWEKRLYLTTFGLFALSGLSLAIFGLILLRGLSAGQPAVIDYTLSGWLALQIIEGEMELRPFQLGQFLLLTGLLLPAAFIRPLQWPPADSARFRLKTEWRKAYILLLPLAMLGLALATNFAVNSLTPRNLMIILPSLVMVVAVVVSSLPWPGQTAVAILVLIYALTAFRVFVANGPYLEIVHFMAADYRTDSRIIVDAPLVWEHVPIAYYVRERLHGEIPVEDLFHFMVPGQETVVDTMPQPPVHLATDTSAASLRQLGDFIGNSPQVWYIRSGDSDPTIQAALDTALKQHYIQFRSDSWGEPEYPPYNAVEYRRLPDQPQTVYLFAKGDNQIALKLWTLLNDVNVQPCQQITLDSWWLAERRPTINFSLTLVLANSDGSGIARTDGGPSNSLMKLWQTNRLYLDERSLTIPCDIAPGHYSLLAGLYNYETLAALPVTQPDANAGQRYGYLTTLNVP